MKVASFDHNRDVVIKCQVRVESDTEALDGRRQRYGSARDVDGGDVLGVPSLEDTELNDLRLRWVKDKAVVRQPVV